jgi:synaptobrevin family protein YKT6
MKLINITLFVYKGVESSPLILHAADQLSGFGYFSRSTILEHLRFGSRLIVGRTPVGQHRSVEMKDNPFLIYTYIRSDHLAGCVVVDEEYPSRVAYDLIHVAMQKFDDYETTNSEQKHTS